MLLIVVIACQKEIPTMYVLNLEGSINFHMLIKKSKS